MTIPWADFSWMAAMDNNTRFKGDLWTSGDHEDFVLKTPWPMISLTASYLYFVLVFGPSFMKTKSPLGLKRTMLVYNAAQVAFSFWWFYESLSIMALLGWKESFSLAAGCSSTNSQLQLRINELCYWYLISKFVELLDTIFFVLRGKQSQVTFLHVYHHTNMAVSTWFFIRYNQGTQSMIMGACNSFVHVIMYAYYLLAALGPSIQRYLWWKRYITVIQITQFVLILSYLGSLSIFGCRVGKAFLTFSAVNTLSFLVLFVHFYVKAYNKRRSAKISSSRTAPEQKERRNFNSATGHDELAIKKSNKVE